MRAIDADAIVVHKFPSEDYDPSENDAEKAYRKGWNDALDAVAEFQPSAEPVRMKGKWLNYATSEHWMCSVCGERAPFWIDWENSSAWDVDHSEWLSDFCPNCGASMSEGEEDEL